MKTWSLEYTSTRRTICIFMTNTKYIQGKGWVICLLEIHRESTYVCVDIFCCYGIDEWMAVLMLLPPICVCVYVWCSARAKRGKWEYIGSSLSCVLSVRVSGEKVFPIIDRHYSRNLCIGKHLYIETVPAVMVARKHPQTRNWNIVVSLNRYSYTVWCHYNAINFFKILTKGTP